MTWPRTTPCFLGGQVTLERKKALTPIPLALSRQKSGRSEPKMWRHATPPQEFRSTKQPKHEQTTQKHIKDICFFGDVTREKFHQNKPSEIYIEISNWCLFCMSTLVWWEGLVFDEFGETDPRTCSQRHSKHQSLHGLKRAELRWISERNFSSDTQMGDVLEEKSFFFAFCFFRNSSLGWWHNYHSSHIKVRVCREILNLRTRYLNVLWLNSRQVLNHRVNNIYSILGICFLFNGSSNSNCLEGVFYMHLDQRNGAWNTSMVHATVKTATFRRLEIFQPSNWYWFWWGTKHDLVEACLCMAVQILRQQT